MDADGKKSLTLEPIQIYILCSADLRWSMLNASAIAFYDFIRDVYVTKDGWIERIPKEVK